MGRTYSFEDLKVVIKGDNDLEVIKSGEEKTVQVVGPRKSKRRRVRRNIKIGDAPECEACGEEVGKGFVLERKRKGGGCIITHALDYRVFCGESCQVLYGISEDEEEDDSGGVFGGLKPVNPTVNVNTRCFDCGRDYL